MNISADVAKENRQVRIQKLQNKRASAEHKQHIINMKRQKKEQMKQNVQQQCQYQEQLNEKEKEEHRQQHMQQQR